MNSENSSQRVAKNEDKARSDGIAEGIARLRRALRRGARVADPANKLAVAQLEVLAALTENPGARRIPGAARTGSVQVEAGEHAVRGHKGERPDGAVDHDVLVHVFFLCTSRAGG